MMFYDSRVQVCKTFITSLFFQKHDGFNAAMRQSLKPSCYSPTTVPVETIIIIILLSIKFLQFTPLLLLKEQLNNNISRFCKFYCNHDNLLLICWFFHISIVYGCWCFSRVE